MRSSGVRWLKSGSLKAMQNCRDCGVAGQPARMPRRTKVADSEVACETSSAACAPWRRPGTAERRTITMSGAAETVAGHADVLEDFLMPAGITQKEAAARLLISYPRMNEIVNGKRSVTPDTALRLGKFTNTEPEFWLDLQQAVDLWDAMHADEAAELKEIKPAHVA
jgi:antitoxin HigA-1